MMTALPLPYVPTAGLVVWPSASTYSSRYTRLVPPALIFAICTESSGCLTARKLFSPTSKTMPSRAFTWHGANELIFAFYTLGQIYLRLHDYTSAQSTFQTLLRTAEKMKDKNHQLLWNTYVSLSSIYETQKKQDLMLETLQKAIDIEESFSDIDITNYNPYHKLGVANFKLGRYEEAWNYLEKALNRENKITKNYYRLGLIYIDIATLCKANKAFEDALEFYQAAIESLKDNEQGNYDIQDLYHEIGDLYQKLGRYKEAKASYERAFEK